MMADTMLHQRHLSKIVILILILLCSSVLAHGRGIKDHEVAPQKSDQAKLYRTYIDQGNSYAHQGQWNKALEEYNKSIALNPTDPAGYMLRGNSYYMQKEYQKAIEDLTRSINLNPDQATACEGYSNRADSYIRKGRYV